MFPAWLVVQKISEWYKLERSVQYVKFFNVLKIFN
jgi:hypothetical protein